MLPFPWRELECEPIPGRFPLDIEETLYRDVTDPRNDGEGTSSSSR